MLQRLCFHPFMCSVCISQLCIEAKLIWLSSFPFCCDLACALWCTDAADLCRSEIKIFSATMSWGFWRYYISALACKTSGSPRLEQLKRDGWISGVGSDSISAWGGMDMFCAQLHCKCVEVPHVAENCEKIRKGKWFCLTNPNPVCSDWSFPAFWLVSCKLEPPLSTSLSLGFLPHTRSVFLSSYLQQTRVLFTINPLTSLWAQCWRAQLNTLTF